MRERIVSEVLKVRYVGCVLLSLGVLAGPAWAQNTTQSVEVEPLTCWWRAKASAVRMGEPFAVLLTCSVLESDAARAVVDRSRLGPAAVQFPPYEVMGGTQSADHVTPGRRFIQYEYRLRLISEDGFGVDVPIPALSIAYRIESQVQQDAAVQGREQTYVLPALPMRVSSLVPEGATHIREAGVPTLSDIAAREFRARMFRLVALILVAVAALTLVISLLRWAQARRAGSLETHRHLLPHRAVLARVGDELRALQQETRAGWTPETVARGLVATRIVASYVVDHPVPQRVLDREPASGELAVGGGFFSRRRVAVSGATTPRGAQQAVPEGDSHLGDLDEAITQLTTARYGRTGELKGSVLDDALASAVRARARVASKYTWLAELLASVKHVLFGWRPQAWTR
jgi:hypothetical protein